MDALERARKLLEKVTPLKRNCGGLCGDACCQSDETGENGMLLFPGEERYYLNDPAYALRDNGRIICLEPCERHNRPLACRLFPLVALPGGKVMPDMRAFPVCPLMPSGQKGLSEEFVKAAEEAARILAADEEQAAFLQKTAEILKEYEALRDWFRGPRDVE